ncbi:NAD-dependent epimerase/dehydratase family protein [Streptomyces sp. N2-109]|uniref:NAD-dependent epimerase/dehydratase family protein n=1 Tax=Streptomyces gossypii TaxID=2883101 RepID=A0ABT2JPL3_9ACTN|nr:NAD-dependent epimerase/dehydratase family protein [Streptomyces gossypii]MCT2589813.1 NAD-dependent epimerase/dehydratase family protein [Streptomyces gossypii]
MRILVLGGTWFLGRAVAEAALARGWEVTVFHRGRTGTPPDGARTVHGDRTVAADLARLAGEGRWDAVVDTSAGELPPRDVLAGARLLEPVAGRYVFTSTVNAYRGWPDEPLSEDSLLLDGPPDADGDYGRLPADWDGPDWYYGRQKAGAERAVTSAFGAALTVILRPGVILGPGEYVGRLPWWLHRAEQGGRMIAPGSPEKAIQPVDVRDVADFALLQATAEGGGAYNCAAPVGHSTMGDFLTACVLATGGEAQLVWAPDKLLVDHGVSQWTELPLWRTHAGVWRVDSTRAQAAGLTCRPLSETVADTWAWLRGGGAPVTHPRQAEHGIAPEKEASLLAVLGRTDQPPRAS